MLLTPGTCIYDDLCRNTFDEERCSRKIDPTHMDLLTLLSEGAVS